MHYGEMYQVARYLLKSSIGKNDDDYYCTSQALWGRICNIDNFNVVVIFTVNRSYCVSDWNRNRGIFWNIDRIGNVCDRMRDLGL